MQRRPGFPARLDGAGGAASKPAPAPLRPTVRPNVPAAPHGVGLDSAAVRARMVQKLAAGGIASPLVLQALSSVERHRFVDSALVNQAYEDTSLPIGLAQTISKPSVVARMCELLLGAECARAGGLGRVLEIGTGCGYQAAVLGRLAREVYSIERLRGLHEKARDNLRHLRLPMCTCCLAMACKVMPRAHPMRPSSQRLAAKPYRRPGVINWPWAGASWRPWRLLAGSKCCLSSTKPRTD